MSSGPCGSPKPCPREGPGRVGAADTVETDGTLDTYPLSFRETEGSRRGSGALFETEGFVQSPMLIFPSPYESYAKTVSRFTLLREARDGEAVTLEAGREKRTPSSKRLAYGSTRT